MAITYTDLQTALGTLSKKEPVSFSDLADQLRARFYQPGQSEDAVDDEPRRCCVCQGELTEYEHDYCEDCRDGGALEDVLDDALSVSPVAAHTATQSEPTEFSGYFDDNECSGSTIKEYLENCNEIAVMDAMEIGGEFVVDAVYYRTERWRVINDVPWEAERIEILSPIAALSSEDTGEPK